MYGSGRESLLNVRVWSGGPPGCLGEVGRPSRMSGSSQEALPNVWESLSNVCEWSGGSL